MSITTSPLFTDEKHLDPAFWLPVIEESESPLRRMDNYVIEGKAFTIYRKTIFTSAHLSREPTDLPLGQWRIGWSHRDHVGLSYAIQIGDTHDWPMSQYRMIFNSPVRASTIYDQLPGMYFGAWCIFCQNRTEKLIQKLVQHNPGGTWPELRQLLAEAIVDCVANAIGMKMGQL